MFSDIIHTLFSNTEFLIAFLCILVTGIFFIVILFFQKKPILINRGVGLVSVLLICLSIMVCVASVNLGTVYIKTSGDPSLVVDQFFSSIVSGNYNQAYLYLSDYSTLELESSQSSDSSDSELIRRHLKSSYSYELVGFAKTEGLTSTQTVKFSFLDLQKVKDDAESRIDSILNDKVQTLPRNQLFDDNGDYLPELLDQVYLEALTASLEDLTPLMSTVTYEVELAFSNNKWTLKTNDIMIKGFLGEK